MIGVSIWFLVLMVLLGGIVAYLGDTIGRTIGKKRLKVWRLRPKHTAALGTFLAGMTGTALTIAALAFFAEPVRVWIFEGEQARIKLISTEKRLKETQSDVQDLQGRADNLQANLEGMGVELDKTGTELKSERQNLTDARSENRRLSSESRKVIAQLATFKVNVNNLRKDITKFQTQRVGLENEISLLKRNGDRVKGDNASIQTENLKLIAAQSDLEKTLKKLNEDYATLNQTYATAQTNFDTQLNGYRRDLQTAQSDLSEASKKLKAEQGKLEEIQNYTMFLEGKSTPARLNAIIYRRHDELSRVPVRNGLTLVEAKQAVSLLLASARNDAKDHGARQTGEGSYAGILKDQPNNLSPDQQVEILAQKLVGNKNHRVLVTRALGNAFEGEFVPVEIVVYDDPIVYSQGDVVFQVQLDGRKTTADVAEQLMVQLAGELTKKLVKDGMIPAVGKSIPLGEVPNTMVLKIVEEVKEAGIRMRVQFLASSDIRASDQVKLGYRLRV